MAEDLEISTCMSEVLALAVAHKKVNYCIIKFPGLHWVLIPDVLLDVAIRDETFAPQGTEVGIIAG